MLVSDVAVYGRCAIDGEMLWVLKVDIARFGIMCLKGHCVIEKGIKNNGPWDDTPTEAELQAALDEAYP